MWWESINVGLKAVGGWNSAKAANASIEANNRLSKVGAEVSNKLSTAGNAARGAKGSLDRWMQSVNNNNVLDAGGDALAANLQNFRRQSDAALRQDFSSGVKSAEQEGAAAAAAALAGIDGNVVDMVNGSVVLRDSIVKQQASDYQGYAEYDTMQRAGRIMTQMVGGLDNSLIIDVMDNKVAYAQREATVNPYLSAITAALPSVPALAKAIGSSGSAPSFTKESAPGSLAIRSRSSSSFDLADQYTDNRGKFSFGVDPKAEPGYDPYSLWSGNAVNLGNIRSR